MPTYVLDGDGTAALPLRPVTVSLQVVGTRSAVGLAAVTPDGSDPGAVLPVPGMMVLPRVSGPVVVRVVPAPGDALFPPGTTVHVSLAAGARDDVDPDRAVLTPVDVSGLAHADLVRVDRSGERVVVAAVKTAVDAPLAPLAAAARTAARGVLGVDQLPAEERVDVVVAVDTSASLLTAVRDGSVAAAVEAVVGLAQVVGGAAPLRVGLLAATPPGAGAVSGPRWLPPTPDAGWGPAVVAALAEHPLTVGFRSAEPGLAGLAPDGNAVVFVLTDAVPVDAAALAAAGEVPGEARHLVVLAPRPSAPAPVPAGLPVTVLPPPPRGTAAADRLLARPDELAALVRSLVVGTVAPESTFAARVGR